MPPLIHPATGLAIGDPNRLPLDITALPSGTEIAAAVDRFILSASGWRGVFAETENGTDAAEGRSASIGAPRTVLAATAAVVFAAAVKRWKGKPNPTLIIGMDTRPTGPTIADVMTRVLLAEGCDLRYAFIVSAPEIMAYARSSDTEVDGFVYISASHNPIGHNGLKFGLSDGGVLGGAAAAELIADFKRNLTNPDLAAAALEKCAGATMKAVAAVYSSAVRWKRQANSAYLLFTREVITGSAEPRQQEAIFDRITEAVKERPLGIVADFNGSARSLGLDIDLLTALGVATSVINGRPGAIAHRIVPEGEALEPCRQRLDELHAENPAFNLGYVCDCDGDRGNVVIWDDAIGRGRILEAQEVFALCCLAELAYYDWRLAESETAVRPPVAVAINDPTSFRIDAIARGFGADVFRAEVGEANVVSLARELRGRGYAVPILGEGAAGGNITHPSAVRDPLDTVFSLIKLLTIRSRADRPGLFEIWCRRSGRLDLYHDDFNLADIAASLPPYTTTSAYETLAGLQVKTADHAVLKNSYERLFVVDWQRRQKELADRFGFDRWQAFAYNGPSERPIAEHFGEAGRGGLKIVFYEADGEAVASLWMRGSGTEPIFRVMAEVKGRQPENERELLRWHRSMIAAADEAASRKEGEN